MGMGVVGVDRGEDVDVDVDGYESMDGDGDGYEWMYMRNAFE